MRAYAEMDGGEVKQVQGVNARRYSKIRGPHNITIINTKCGNVKPNTK